MMEVAATPVEKKKWTGEDSNNSFGAEKEDWVRFSNKDLFASCDDTGGEFTTTTHTPLKGKEEESSRPTTRQESRHIRHGDKIYGNRGSKQVLHEDNKNNNEKPPRVPVDKFGIPIVSRGQRRQRQQHSMRPSRRRSMGEFTTSDTFVDSGRENGGGLPSYSNFQSDSVPRIAQKSEISVGGNCDGGDDGFGAVVIKSASKTNLLRDSMHKGQQERTTRRRSSLGGFARDDDSSSNSIAREDFSSNTRRKSRGSHSRQQQQQPQHRSRRRKSLGEVSSDENQVTEITNQDQQINKEREAAKDYYGYDDKDDVVKLHAASYRRSRARRTARRSSMPLMHIDSPEDARRKKDNDDDINNKPKLDKFLWNNQNNATINQWDEDFGNETIFTAPPATTTRSIFEKHQSCNSTDHGSAASIAESKINSNKMHRSSSPRPSSRRRRQSLTHSSSTADSYGEHEINLKDGFEDSPSSCARDLQQEQQQHPRKQSERKVVSLTKNKHRPRRRSGSPNRTATRSLSPGADCDALRHGRRTMKRRSSLGTRVVVEAAVPNNIKENRRSGQQTGLPGRRSRLDGSPSKPSGRSSSPSKRSGRSSSPSRRSGRSGSPIQRQRRNRRRGRADTVEKSAMGAPNNEIYGGIPRQPRQCRRASMF